MKNLLILLATSVVIILAGCDMSDSPAVSSCKTICESSQSLQRLQKKVVYKPVKLCKKRCDATEGTCMEGKAKAVNVQACIFYGMNAGSMKPRKNLNPFR